MDAETNKPDRKPDLADRLRQIPLTREGLFWFLVATAMLVTGLAKSINLITLLACFLVVLVVWNYALAARQLRGLEVRRVETEPIFAGTPYPWTVKLHNTSQRAASGVRVRDGAGGQEQQWFVPEVAAGAALLLQGEATFPARGPISGQALTLVCGYPLGLAHVTRPAAGPPAWVVLPRLGRLQRGTLRRLLSRQSPSIGQSKGVPCHVPTAQSEFHGLRSYRPGDSPRHIHWRTTARRGEMMVREFEEFPNDNLLLIVEAWRPTDPEGAPDPTLERTISLAATVCWEWCRQKGDRLTLLLAGATPRLLTGVTGQALALELLECLALEPGTDQVDGAALVELLHRQRELPVGPALFVSSRGDALAELLASSLHRKVAAVDVRAGEEEAFFEL